MLKSYSEAEEKEQARIRETEEFRESYLTFKFYLAGRYRIADKNCLSLFAQVEITFPDNFKIE